ncbi:hypothetical protein KKH23_09045 [Patescibacteria group bacterium]|nr:hypothetical protein [Patescibacteria group bacterium]
MSNEMLEDTLNWIREQDIAKEDKPYKIWDRVRLKYGLSRYQASELTLKVLKKMK